jgi:phage tail tape-measure protein
MKTNKTKKGDKKKNAHVAHEAEGVASGAAAGAILGAGAGPAGIVAGALIGGAAGAVAASALEKDAARKAAHARELDEQIGVTKGDLGAPNLKHPPARVGAYSAASAGAGTSGDDEEPAEGPIPSGTK